MHLFVIQTLPSYLFTYLVLLCVNIIVLCASIILLRTGNREEHGSNCMNEMEEGNVFNSWIVVLD